MVQGSVLGSVGTKNTGPAAAGRGEGGRQHSSGGAGGQCDCRLGRRRCSGGQLSEAPILRSETLSVPHAWRTPRPGSVLMPEDATDQGPVAHTHTQEPQGGQKMPSQGSEKRTVHSEMQGKETSQQNKLTGPQSASPH